MIAGSLRREQPQFGDAEVDPRLNPSRAVFCRKELGGVVTSAPPLPANRRLSYDRYSDQGAWLRMVARIRSAERGRELSDAPKPKNLTGKRPHVTVEFGDDSIAALLFLKLASAPEVTPPIGHCRSFFVDPLTRPLRRRRLRDRKQWREAAKRSRDAAYDRVVHVLKVLRMEDRLGWGDVLDLTRQLNEPLA